MHDGNSLMYPEFTPHRWWGLPITSNRGREFSCQYPVPWITTLTPQYIRRLGGFLWPCRKNGLWTPFPPHLQERNGFTSDKFYWDAIQEYSHQRHKGASYPLLLVSSQIWCIQSSWYVWLCVLFPSHLNEEYMLRNSYVSWSRADKLLWLVGRWNYT